MFQIFLSDRFKREMERLDKPVREQIEGKIWELENYPMIGKKLRHSPYWSLRVGKHRVIYEVLWSGNLIRILRVLEREKDYRELR